RIEVLCSRKWQNLCDAAACCAPLSGGYRHRLRSRFGAGNLRRHERAADCLYVKHLRHTWFASSLLHAGRGRRQVLPAQVRTRGGAAVCRVEDGVAESTLRRTLSDLALAGNHLGGAVLISGTLAGVSETKGSSRRYSRI